jgi:hypothetical protein
MAAAALAVVSDVLGSDTTLLFTLRGRSIHLSDLEEEFRNLVISQKGRREQLQIVSFKENLPTRVFGLFSVGLVSVRAEELRLLIV